MTPQTANEAITTALTSLAEPLRSELDALDDLTARQVFNHAKRRLAGLVRTQGLEAASQHAYRITQSCLRQAKTRRA